MRCDDATEMLSAYFDQELGVDDAAGVRQHVLTCERCQAELQSFAQIRSLAGQHQEPTTAAPPWESVVAKLQASQLQASQLQAAQQVTPGTELVPHHLGTRTKGLAAVAVAIAASILFMFAVRRPDQPVDQTAGHLHSQSEPTPINFQHVVSGFQQDAMLASETFSAWYAGQDVSIESAEKQLGYHPQVKLSLPAGVQLVSARLLKLPECHCDQGQCLCGPNGCNCLASMCERPDGSKLMLVETCKSQTSSFGNLPTQLVHRGNRILQVTQTEKGLAASWEGASARMTAIGLRDLSELDGLLVSN